MRYPQLVELGSHETARRFVGYLLTMFVGLMVFVIVVGYGQFSDGRGGVLISALGMGLLALLGSYALSLSTYAKRMRARGAAQSLRKESRPPILLLRAFEDDYMAVEVAEPSKPWWAMGATRPATFEQTLSDLFSRSGPVIAIGRPGETVPPLGAYRFWINNDRWQQAVDELLKECQFVVMIMGRLHDRPGLTWEAERLFRLDTPDKVVLVMPPLDRETARERWDEYRRLSGERMPAYQSGELAVTFNPGGTCQVARANRNWRKGVSDWQEYVLASEQEIYRAAIQIEGQVAARAQGITRVNFDRICEGMSEAEVVAILGVPPGDYRRYPNYVLRGPGHIPLDQRANGGTLEVWYVPGQHVEVLYDKRGRVIGKYWHDCEGNG
jgi:hypothetical protein